MPGLRLTRVKLFVVLTLVSLFTIFPTKTQAADTCTATVNKSVNPGDTYKLTVTFSEGSRAFLVRYSGTNSVSNTYTPTTNPFSVDLTAPSENFSAITVSSAPRQTPFSCTATVSQSSDPGNNNPGGGNSQDTSGGNTSNSDNPNAITEVDPKAPVNTALGIIPTDPTQLVNVLLTIAFGVAGGIAFLLIVYGGFRLVFSQGDPKAVQEAREVITSAIIGLLIIVFSVFILNLIGIDVLGLPIG